MITCIKSVDQTNNGMEKIKIKRYLNSCRERECKELKTNIKGKLHDEAILFLQIKNQQIQTL
jgi:hypothetical protein